MTPNPRAVPAAPTWTAMPPEDGARTDDTAVMPVVPPPPRSYPPAPDGWSGEPPRRGRVLRITGMVLACLLAVGAAVLIGLHANRQPSTFHSDIQTDTPDVKHPPQRDAGVGTCTIDAAGVHVTGTVTNTSTRRADYVIEVALEDSAGGRITAGMTAVQALDPGVKTAWTATLPPQASTASAPVCKIVKVNRAPS